MVRYLCIFVQQYPTFRYRELLAVASMFNIKIWGIDESLLPIIESDVLEISSPFLYMDLESDEDVKKICSRTVLVRGFYRVWAESNTYQGLLDQLANNYDPEFISTFHKDKIWKIEFDSFGRRFSKEDQLERMHRLKPSPLWSSGKVSMNPNGVNEHVVWRLTEDYGLSRDTPELMAERAQEKEKEKEKENEMTTTTTTTTDNQVEKGPQNMYLGILVAKGNRESISQFNLQDRKYLGTTSMDPELSIISANMGHVRPGSFMLDPFVGTGSFVLISSYFGAQTVGCDIDVAAMRKTQTCNLETNFEQLGLLDNLVGVVICDNSSAPWRDGPIFDCIITDPPYGIRAGAKRVGYNKNRRHKAPPEGFKWSHMAQTTEYKVPDVMADLLELAAKKLVIGGRLVYWLPTTPEYV
ncbi:tRNA guanosine-2'-O-methyltransferase 11 [Heterostelium album PN500]|uniref:tRNA (guanine(10)-N(2))-methyltransferase n=1 Tax=Heterostelium pallidum (strain ATCC 26659 / Pp 5 / PN500) TaxID=670386 RepID=D3BNV1_HETP5|nr:tRNA guanosine-2'-O-methyltransferase 11 [Heterostelium album PN500]EFA76870.1 tRNA guanosine-2'-O-methyltransferase 11 [Heterostelium album PN500]|eukprot:XP_020429002.1 tRNA guanosine-2'-O-methyltransferase 11 [Heterostelium album PN500]